MSYLDRDQQLADAGVPLCPRCGERDRVLMPGNFVGEVFSVTHPWCERCMGFVGALEPKPKRWVPDF